MTRFYITFGWGHIHYIEGKTLDKDSVAVLDMPTYDGARRKAFELFGPVFGSVYTEKEWNERDLAQYFPRGLIGLLGCEVTKEQHDA